MIDEFEEIDDDKGTETTYADDALGRELQNKYITWQSLRKLVELEWLQDLRAYNQVNEINGSSESGRGATVNKSPLTTYHEHIYSGMARAKADTAYSRIISALFMGAEKHWGISPTPVPDIGNQYFSADEMQAFKSVMQTQAEVRAQAMESEMDDQLLNM